MSLKNYDRNQKKRKEYIKQSGLLLAGVDVSKANHDACMGTLESARCRIWFRIGCCPNRISKRVTIKLPGLTIFR